MQTIKRMYQDITEQTDALGIERELVNDYLSCSQKARRMIELQVFGLVFDGHITTAQKKVEEFMDALDKLQSMYSETGALVAKS